MEVTAERKAQRRKIAVVIGVFAGLLNAMRWLFFESPLFGGYQPAERYTGGSVYAGVSGSEMLAAVVVNLGVSFIVAAFGFWLLVMAVAWVKEL